MKQQQRQLSPIPSGTEEEEEEEDVRSSSPTKMRSSVRKPLQRATKPTTPAATSHTIELDDVDEDHDEIIGDDGCISYPPPLPTSSSASARDRIRSLLKDRSNRVFAAICCSVFLFLILSIWIICAVAVWYGDILTS